MHLYEQRRRPIRGYVITGVVFALVIALFIYVLFGVSGTAGARELELLKASLRRAAVTCFAVEGRYPPSLDYMERHYGVVVNSGRYIVRYEAFASNVMPSITVIKKGGN